MRVGATTPPLLLKATAVRVLVLAAAMFTAAWLHRNQELIALMAAGISRVRVDQRKYSLEAVGAAAAVDER